MKAVLEKLLIPHWRTRIQLALLFTLAMTVSQGISLWIIKNQNANIQVAINRFHLLENTTSAVTLLNVLNTENRYIGITSLSDHRKGIFLSQHPWPLISGRSLDDLVVRLSQMLDFSPARIQINNKIDNEKFCLMEKTQKEKSITTNSTLEKNKENTDQKENSENKNKIQSKIDKITEACQSDFFVSAQLDDGQWLNFYFHLGPPSRVLISKVLPGILASLLLIIIITNLTLNRITLPLQQLSRGAEKVGRGETYIIPASGPQDVKQTIIAFNDMQKKLNRFIKDRTHLMAAISHDLRTPITVMRLRLELFEHSDDKIKLLETLDEMESITIASLNFVRESNIEEDTKDIDINALLASICDDLQETGLETYYKEHSRIIYSCRSKSLKRALTNLVHNGAIYGKTVGVNLHPIKNINKANTHTLEIHINDQGPGIPNDMHETIFEPFVRLENSRNRKTGGTGLGLSIARTIVRHHGGDILLRNQPEGFSVVVQLP